MGKVIHIDFEKCTACLACLAACQISEGHNGKERNYVEYVDFAKSRQAFPMLCMQCEHPSCVASCPTEAIEITPEGIVLSAMEDKCVGCRSCTIACPFGIPKFDSVTNKMYKCDMCYERTKEGITPMCASVCTAGAISFIDSGVCEAPSKSS